MQLSKIKMSGFKSFVDPTTVNLPSKLIAVVGPNGCGKSNIIDAVTWVMGESSPKYLRGESLTDVIFNGSTSRKPIGQASVELVFDNSDGGLGGEYAKFAEISIKRVINRESDSTYYLNGVRCRKRDVVDIFLGTGLGPRSYSIIGQNMISRIIEAKPDDLRTYLEEAAGISKYKERRHETELRIKHTKENLDRVNDVQMELERQLSHLKQQANTAEKFKTLKQQERTLRAELYAIQWRQLDSMMVDATLNIQREETALEARQSELSGTDRDIEQIRHEQRAARDAFQEVQRRYYAVGNEITRMEQDVLHHQERQQQWEGDLKKTNQDWQVINDQIDIADESLCELEHDIQQSDPQLAAATREMQALETELIVSEESMQAWQNQWDEFNSNAAKTSQTVQVEKTQVQHLEQRITLLKKRQEQLRQDQGQFNFVELTKEIDELAEKSYEAKDAVVLQNTHLADIKREITTLQMAERNANTKLDETRGELQRLRGQQASLEALQQTALGQRDNSTAPWVTKHQLNSKQRLGQNIEVAKGWELAVEKALGFCLQAICVDKMGDVTPHLDDFKSGNLCVVVAGNTATSAETKAKGELLLEKIKSSLPLASLLAGIYVADNVDDALKRCESLNDHESIMTKDGVWLNRSWLKILREDDPAAGVFQREQELKQITLRINQLKAKQTELEKEIAQKQTQIQDLEEERDELQATLNQQQAQAAQLNAQHKMKEERLAEVKKQSERFAREQEECFQQLKQAEAEMTQANALWQEATTKLDEQTQVRETLTKERDTVRQQLQMVRDKVNQKKTAIHQLEIRSQTAKSKKNSLQQNILQLQTQLASLNERKITLQSELTSMQPMDVLQKALSRALDKHVSVEVELNTCKIAAETLDQEFRHLEEKRQLIERDSNKLRGTLETLRVEWQGWKVKAETILENFQETECKLEDVLKELPQGIQADEWQAKLDQTVQRINRLGPINLVAIEEYATCLERKQYLDKQVEDLQAGLTTLEDAISKIDKETRSRFKETFDTVNARFQELFPTIFGGGRAYLELTSDDLLSAGVTTMACPPGKRNSSIYLLSGGEKSLTAIALIFSIFHLNPAPFCMLDEVDAALDDANVLRFTRLVKVMSERLQFIFISHNKITIEMGDHLIGVTMNEPGVSRLVSVDMDKAISLAGS